MSPDEQGINGQDNHSQRTIHFKKYISTDSNHTFALSFIMAKQGILNMLM